MKTTAWLLSVAVLGTGCSLQPKLLRHYAEFTRIPNAPAAVQLSVFPANPGAVQESPLVLVLSENAQAALIRSLSDKMSASGGATELMSTLATPTVPSADSCAWANKTSMSKRLVFTALGNLTKPADRLDKLDIQLIMKQGSGISAQSPAASFVSWDRFKSDYLAYPMGTAKLTQVNKFNAGMKRTGTGNLPDGAGSLEKVFNLGYEADRTLEESAQYALGRLSVGGALTPTTARLVQEGGPNVTLFGSSSATISFSLASYGYPAPVYTFTLQHDNKVAEPLQVKFDRCLSNFPRSNQPIIAGVSGTAWLREVVSGDGTVSEGDDTVRMSQVQLDGEDVILASTPELTVQHFGLAQCGLKVELGSCKPLYIEHGAAPAGGAEWIQLASADEAAKLRIWLIGQAKTREVKSIGGFAIGLAPYNGKTTTSAASLTGVDGSTAATLRVVRLGENTPPDSIPVK